MSFFEHSRHLSFHDPHFEAAQGNIINNYNYSSSSTTQLERKDTDGWPDSVNDFEKIKLGDIKIIETLRIQQLEMQIKDDSPDPGLQETNPFRVQIAQQKNTLKAVKVTRSVHTATICGRGSDKFTVVIYEAPGKNDKNTFAVCKPEYDFWSQRRHAKLPQLFGVTCSSLLALIYHNVRVNYNEVWNHYQMSHVILPYLNILRLIDYEEVYSAAPEILGDYTPSSYWEFDFSTQSFCYNLDFPINTHIANQAESSNNPQFCYTEFTGTLDYFRRPQIPPPALENGTESELAIIQYVSHITGEYLDSIAMLGNQDLNVDPLEIALDGSIPFGACFEKQWDNNRGPILASFQSLDLTPEWVPQWWQSTVDMDIANWSSVNSQVRISFLDWQQGGDFLFQFSLALPMDMKRCVRHAFLSQSFIFMEKAEIGLDSSHDCYLLDHMQFEIKGQFKPPPNSSATSSVPIYLFIDPLKTEIINGLPCLKYPPENPFMHWSLDPDGPIAPIDVDKYGLPQLEVQTSFGTWWSVRDYKAVKQYLHSKGYNLYSTKYAEDKGYLLLTYINAEETELSIQEVTEATTSTASDIQNVIEATSDTPKLQWVEKLGSTIGHFVDKLAKGSEEMDINPVFL